MSILAAESRWHGLKWLRRPCMTLMRKSMMVWPSCVLDCTSCARDIGWSFAYAFICSNSDDSVVCGWSCVKGSFVGVSGEALRQAQERSERVLPRIKYGAGSQGRGGLGMGCPSTSFLRQAQDERFTGLPTLLTPHSSIGKRRLGGWLYLRVLRRGDLGSVGQVLDLEVAEH